MELTIDELAAETGTTTRRIRSFQTFGLLDYPRLRGRTGLYTNRHVDRLLAIHRLQAQGFSLQSLAVLFDAHRRGESLDSVLGIAGSGGAAGVGTARGEVDEAELYGFTVLEGATGPRSSSGRRTSPLLSIVPTTVWIRPEAS